LADGYPDEFTVMRANWTGGEEPFRRTLEAYRAYKAMQQTGLSARVIGPLMRAGLRTPEQVMALTDDELLLVPMLGRKGLQEIRRVLPGNS
jgi:DNA-directed RNA polymerase alpha subunit